MTPAVVEQIVRDFTEEFVKSRTRQLGQLVPGLDEVIRQAVPAPVGDGDLSFTLAPQEWLTMARYGAGEVDADAGEMRELCQSLAEWLFAFPGSFRYVIPDAWYATPMGSLWAAAVVRAEGDELITLAEAAQLAGAPLSTLVSRVNRGKLRSYTNPAADARQGRRLVRRSEVARA